MVSGRHVYPAELLILLTAFTLSTTFTFFKWGKMASESELNQYLELAVDLARRAGKVCMRCVSGWLVCQCGKTT